MHQPPFQAELLFTPGALLAKGPNFQGQTPDEAEVVASDGTIDQNAYNRLVERRLLPLFLRANYSAAADHKRALITMPGIGAGAFAGTYRNQGIATKLDIAVRAMLNRHANVLDSIELVYYDPFDQGANFSQAFGAVRYRVRPLQFNVGKFQLSHPTQLQEAGDDFTDLKLFKVVAWDHVSFPGNDFFGNARNTDDGVAAAATDSMRDITNVAGNYHNVRYLPPIGFSTWNQVARQNDIRIGIPSREYDVVDESNGQRSVVSVNRRQPPGWIRSPEAIPPPPPTTPPPPPTTPPLPPTSPQSSPSPTTPPIDGRAFQAPGGVSVPVAGPPKARFLRSKISVRRGRKATILYDLENIPVNTRVSLKILRGNRTVHLLTEAGATNGRNRARWDGKITSTPRHIRKRHPGQVKRARLAPAGTYTIRLVATNPFGPDAPITQMTVKLTR